MSQFDEVISRLGTNSAKWDGAKELFGREGVIPMWVADMDFRAPMPVLDAFRSRIDHGVFGYTNSVEPMLDALIDWNKKRHGFKIDRSDVLFNEAVVPSISLAIRSLTEKGDKVLMHSPIYPPFFRVAGEELEREVITTPLEFRNHRFEIDFSDMEAKLKNQDIKLFLLCNPQNPGGRVWHPDELKKMVELCKRHGVLIVSDEIHSDLVMEPFIHTPLMKACPEYQEQIITLMAPTKTFNLADLKVSYLIVPNKKYREKIEAWQKYVHAAGINEFGQIALCAAYREGEAWLDELRAYVLENYHYVKDQFERYAPEVEVANLEATYLMWLDVRKVAKSDEKIYQDIIDAGCGIQMGSDFGENGKGFIRLNIACPRATLENGITCLIKGIQK